MKTTYDVYEIDANEKATLMDYDLSRADAKAKIERLRLAYGSFGLRYIMKREPKNGMVFGDPTTA